MSYDVYKKSLEDRADIELIRDYLDIDELVPDSPIKKIAQVSGICHKIDSNGSPYISMNLKDVRGNILKANWFKKTLSTETLIEIRKQKAVFVQVKAVPGLYMDNINLVVQDMQILMDEDITSKLIAAFSPRYNVSEELSFIRKTNYGEFKSLFEFMDKNGIVEECSEHYNGNYGVAVIGQLASVIMNIFKLIDTMDCNRPLAKIASMYSLIFLGKNMKGDGILTDIPHLLFLLETTKIKFKKVYTNEAMLEEFFSEVERIVCTELNVPVIKSSTSISVKIALNMLKEYGKLVKAKNVPLGSSYLFNGEETINL